MGEFLQAAYRILAEVQKPLSAREITRLAQERGILDTRGKTPWQTMKSKLSTEILKNNQRSLFMRSGKGAFALREWREQVDEHVADRFQRALFDEDIVVFPRTILSHFVPGVGLTKNADLSELWTQVGPMRRRNAEEDKSVVQLVSVFVVKHLRDVLTYKRAKRLPEARLHGFYSLAFGGHLNPDDLAPLFDLSRPDETFPWLVRELHEELHLRKGAIQEMRFHGLLYDDAREVSTQHLGIVYEVQLNSREFEIGERGFLIDPKFETPEEVRARLEEFENWSVILYEEMIRA